MTNTTNDTFTNHDMAQFQALMVAGEKGRLTLFGARLTGDTSGKLFAVLGVVQNRGKDDVTGKDNVAVLPLGVLYREGDMPDIVPFLGDTPTKLVTIVTKEEFVQYEENNRQEDKASMMYSLLGELSTAMEAFAEEPSQEIADKLKDIRRRGVELGAITQEQCDEFNATTDEILQRQANVMQVPIQVDRRDEGKGIADAVMSISLDDHNCETCDSTSTCPQALQEAIKLLRQKGSNLSDDERAKLGHLISEAIGKQVQIQRKQ